MLYRFVGVGRILFCCVGVVLLFVQVPVDTLRGGVVGLGMEVCAISMLTLLLSRVDSVVATVDVPASKFSYCGFVGVMDGILLSCEVIAWGTVDISSVGM